MCEDRYHLIGHALGITRGGAFPSKFFERLLRREAGHRRLGRASTHYVCDEVLQRDGGKAVCCGCTGHECIQLTSEEKNV
jgi:hypothetical protein